MQLSPRQIEYIYQEALANRDGQLPDRINYKWVKDNGAYDITHNYLGNEFHMREFIYGGKIIHTAMRSWVEDPVANQRLPEWMREPWGTYPNLPEKPV